MKRQSSFTLVEILVVIGLITLLTAIITRNLFTARHKASLSTTVLSLVNDIKEQQNTAMIDGNHSLYFETSRYTLFDGSVYTPGDPGNFTVNLDPGLSLTNIGFTGSKIVFASGSGEIVDFVDGQNTITIQNTQTSQAEIININRLGVITSILQ